MREKPAGASLTGNPSAPNVDAPEPMPAVRSPAAPGAHILIADDDPWTVSALTWLLHEQSYQVTSVTDRQQLLEALERTRPDLLLVDVGHLG